MSQDTYSTVKEILTATFSVPEEEVSPDATFEALDLDSLDLVELTLAIEEQLGVKIEDDELEGIRTVGDAVAAIDRRTAVSA